MLEPAAKLSGEPEGGHEVAIETLGRPICSTKNPEMNRRVGDSVTLA